ncbi:class GN sortase [Shewanella pealeana]|uniref:Sortase family protein n=1 Tax=Shewanella pealeana (strain ATCC 700345 / ANG-SQ1) TaxID=398579 RepID=A8H5J8_SHEPA|nr:class GN sortase [Shewanella pealeana]ABV87835.1 sortase family protein [Shewanella pealeana ATCC 700345]
MANQTEQVVKSNKDAEGSKKLCRDFNRYFPWLLVATGIALIIQGGYMQVKAHFAQFLIQQAWQRTLEDRKPHKPWSWADTHPVAKLEFLPSAEVQDHIESQNTLDTHDSGQGDSLYVLSGASGRNLAFGPALMLSSSEFDEQGNTVIAGHRDTHFARLNGVKVGQLIKVQSASGKRRLYRVFATLVTHESDMSVTQDSHDKLLTLVTCYPFGASFAGGPLRFVVKAEPI